MNKSWALVALLLLTPAPADAREKLCGQANASDSRSEIFVEVGRWPGKAPVLNEMKAEFRSAEGNFGLRLTYDLTEGQFGAPQVDWVVAYMPLPDPNLAPPQRIEWRIGDGPWSGARYTDRPVRRSKDPNEIEGYLWGRPTGDDLSALNLAVARREPIALRRLDHDGQTLAEGAVQIPPASAVQALNVKARSLALAALKACSPPPLVIPPARF